MKLGTNINLSIRELPETQFWFPMRIKDITPPGIIVFGCATHIWREIYTTKLPVFKII